MTRSAFGMVIDKMFADQERRHEWLIRSGEQIRRMNDEESKEGRVAQQAPANNNGD